MAPFFQWIADTGFHAGIEELRTGYPDIAWQSLPQWAAAQDWPGLVAHRSPGSAHTAS